MNTVIYKYPLEKSIVHMPKGAQILKIAQQHSPVSKGIFIWALVDPDVAFEPRVFKTLMTGLPYEEEDISLLQYIDTLYLYDNTYVLHVFEQINK